MLCSLTVSVFAGAKIQNSSKMVVPYICSRHIWEGNFGSRRLAKLFSTEAQERLDTKDVIVFSTLDPPDPPVPGNIGHFCIVTVNLKSERFHLLDSLHGASDPDANRVLFRMAHGIKNYGGQLGAKKLIHFLRVQLITSTWITSKCQSRVTRVIVDFSCSSV